MLPNLSVTSAAVNNQQYNQLNLRKIHKTTTNAQTSIVYRLSEYNPYLIQSILLYNIYFKCLMKMLLYTHLARLINI